jgi:hypothetical protein
MCKEAKNLAYCEHCHFADYCENDNGDDFGFDNIMQDLESDYHQK